MTETAGRVDIRRAAVDHPTNGVATRRTRGVRARHRQLRGGRILAAFLLVPVGLVLALVLPVIWIVQGRPLFFRAMRAGQNGVPFRLWKLRTMRNGAREDAVLGGDAASNVTTLGRWLRRTRLDELPQIVNLLRGDMVFVGPRPPLPRYVEAYPDLYLPLLSDPPGITGLATVMFCTRETGLLDEGRTSDEVDALYRRRCLRRKARLDAIFARQRGPGLTWFVLILTLWRGPRAQGAMRSVRHRVERWMGLRPPA